jgi:CheY-like chemotaxis protein
MSRPSSLSVFVLEDEALIRMMIVQMVEELGHRVVAEAGSIADALVLAGSAEFDLALLDINVAGATSDRVAMIVGQRGLPFIFVSGYTSTGLPAAFADHRVLQKPFSIPSLRKAIESALAS